MIDPAAWHQEDRLLTTVCSKMYHHHHDTKQKLKATETAHKPLKGNGDGKHLQEIYHFY